MNVQPSNPNAEVLLGHLFGWPIRAGLFFGDPNSTEYLLRDATQTVPTSKQSVTSTFYLGSTFQTTSFPVVSRPVVGTKRGRVWVNRVELRLLEAERAASTRERAEEYQLAHRILRRVFYDNCTNAYYLAFCWMYGGSPEIIGRKQEHYRQFMVRGSALKLDSTALPPKKPVVSVKSLSEKGAANAR